MNEERLSEIEALCADATPGPWWPRWGGEPGYIYSSTTGRVVADVPAEKSDAIVPDDSRFIAAARTAIPELLAEVRRLKDDRLALVAAALG